MAAKKSSAKKPAAVPAGVKYALTAAQALLGHGDRGVEMREADDTWDFALRGTHYATLRLVGQDLEYCFRAPSDLSGFARVIGYYAKVVDRPGWLRITLPAARDPRPGLEAGLGGMLGAALRDVRTAAGPGPLPSIVSAGGPYIGIPVMALGQWEGASAAATYEKTIKGCPDSARVTKIAGRDALLLGTPDALYLWPIEGGVVLARAVSFDADDDTVLRAHLAAVPAGAWASLPGTMKIANEMWFFDAASATRDLLKRDVLEVRLEPGKYKLDAATYRPDGGTELLLVRLSRA